MDGFSRILEKKGGGLLCTRLYLANNYELQSTKNILKPAVANERRSRSLLKAPKRRLDKTLTRNPSIAPFLKPKVASSEGVKVGSKKEALTKSHVDSLVSQKLMSDFFPKN